MNTLARPTMEVGDLQSPSNHQRVAGSSSCFSRSSAARAARAGLDPSGAEADSHPPTPRIAPLTGGGGKPHPPCLAAPPTSAGISLDFIGSGDLRGAGLLR